MARRKNTKTTKKQKGRGIVIRMPRGSRPIVQQNGRALPLFLASLANPVASEAISKLIKRKGIFPRGMGIWP